MTSQITGNPTVCSTTFSGEQQRTIRAHLWYWPVVRGIDRWAMDSPHQKASDAQRVSTSWFHHETFHKLQEENTHFRLKCVPTAEFLVHYNDVIMSAMASQITTLTIVYSTVYSGADQRTHQSSASQGFVGGIHLWPANSPHKRPVTRKMFPFEYVIMQLGRQEQTQWKFKKKPIIFNQENVL